jgi:hypothetical protein
MLPEGYDDLKLKKDEIHKKIDNSFNNIFKNLETIFECSKFNDVQFIEETNNLEILSSTESISDNLKDLLQIVYDMKVHYLKKIDYDGKSKKELINNITKCKATIHEKMSLLQEIYNFTNNVIKENKHSRIYKYSLNYNIE